LRFTPDPTSITILGALDAGADAGAASEEEAAIDDAAQVSAEGNKFWGVDPSTMMLGAGDAGLYGRHCCLHTRTHGHACAHPPARKERERGWRGRGRGEVCEREPDGLMALFQCYDFL